jgi:hypothetical protein
MHGAEALIESNDSNHPQATGAAARCALSLLVPSSIFCCASVANNALPTSRDGGSEFQETLGCVNDEFSPASNMHPDAKRSEVYSMYPSAIMWLRKRDAEWLNRHLPAWEKSKPSGRTKGTRARNWQERDARLAAQIPIIAEEFKNIPGPPIRLSIARLRRGIGVRGSGVTDFPKLKAAIEAAAETPFEFVLRKFRKIAKDLPNASSATWADHAGLHKKDWLSDPRFHSALQAAQRESDAWACTSGSHNTESSVTETLLEAA